MRCFLLLLALAAARGQDTCQSGPEAQYLLFGTKTAYNYVNRNLPNLNPQNIPGCQPKAIWLLNRHGATNPEADELPQLQHLTAFRDNVVKNYHDGYNKEPRMCLGDQSLLTRWAWNPRQNLTFAGDLTTNGYMRTEELAQTWVSRYPSLLTDNKHDYMFKFAKDKRSSESFHAFTAGLFRSRPEDLDLPHDNDEKLLKPDKFCPAWSRDIGDSNETLRQRDIFESKHEWADMVSNISSRLGFTYDIDRSIIKNIYQMCRYNKAWDITQISPWCSAFSREDLRRFEYAEDLETFYKYGYGSETSPKLACPLIKDMMDFFYKHVNANVPQQPVSQILFGEAPAVLLLTGALGGRRDDAPLTGDNFHTVPAQSRKWSSSAAAPFNGNLAAVLYKCNPNGNFGYKDRHQILFLQNEQTMDLPFCKVGLCEWSDIKVRLGDIANKCNLDFCNGAATLNGVVALSVGLFAFFVRYLA